MLEGDGIRAPMARYGKVQGDEVVMYLLEVIGMACGVGVEVLRTNRCNCPLMHV